MKAKIPKIGKFESAIYCVQDRVDFHRCLKWLFWVATFVLAIYVSIITAILKIDGHFNHHLYGTGINLNIRD